MPFLGKGESNCWFPHLSPSPFFFLLIFIHSIFSIEPPIDPNVEFPLKSGTASFSGPIDPTTFKLDPDLNLSDTQKKCCAFVRLHTYIQVPVGTAPPYTGNHGFQVLVFIPMEKRPWKVSR